MTFYADGEVPDRTTIEQLVQPCPEGSDPRPRGATCEHPNMRECHEGCGHYYCSDCGLSFDEQAGM